MGKILPTVLEKINPDSPKRREGHRKKLFFSLSGLTADFGHLSSAAAGNRGQLVGMFFRLAGNGLLDDIFQLRVSRPSPQGFPQVGLIIGKNTGSKLSIGG
jgi:hypothetical protein